MRNVTSGVVRGNGGRLEAEIPDVADRFSAKFTPEPMSGCWLWCGTLGRDGYGRFHDGERDVLAHRFAYEHFVGPIQEDTIDHLCRNRQCVNPRHLESVSLAINIRRGAIANRRTHCPHGHEFIPSNIVSSDKRVHRACRRCHIIRQTERNRRLRALGKRVREIYDPVKRREKYLRMHARRVAP